MATITYASRPDGWFWELVTDDGLSYDTLKFYSSKEECLTSAETFRASANTFPSASIVELDRHKQKDTPLAFNYVIEVLPPQSMYHYQWRWYWVMEDGTEVFTLESNPASTEASAREACRKRIEAFVALSSQIAAAEIVEGATT